MKRPFKSLLRLGACLLVIAVLLALAICFENWRGKRAWESYKTQLESKGEHLDLSWFTPPPLPDDQNLAATPLFQPLFDYTRDPATGNIVYKQPGTAVTHIRIDLVETNSALPKIIKWNTGEPVDLQKWQDYYLTVLPALPVTAHPADGVLVALSRYDGDLDTLRDAIQTHPLLRFPISQDDYVATGDTFYEPLLKIEKVLSLRAVAELSAGHPDKAAADVQLGFALVNSLRLHQGLIPGLVRITMSNVMLQPVWEGIASHAWNDEQLSAIGKEVAQFDFLPDYKSSMLAQRADDNWFWDQFRGNPGKLGTSLEIKNAGADNYLRALKLFSGWWYQNQLSQNKFIQDEMLPVVDAKSRRFDPEAVKKSEKIAGDLFSPHSPYAFLAKIMVLTYTKIPIKFALAQTSVDEARIACEIERYRIAHNALPVKLDDLHMADLPHDITTGQPLHYGTIGDDYILYSVGWNGTDESGHIVLKPKTATPDYEQGDWVWSLKPLDKNP